MRTTLDRLFIAHPRAVNENYLAHAGVALRFALLLLGAGLAALMHAIIPALFETTASSSPRRDDGPLRHAAGQTSDMESSARPRWSKGDICVQRQPIVARMLRRMPPGAR
jgi:hypothetical protein